MNKFAKDMLIARYGVHDNRRGDYMYDRRDYTYDDRRRDMRYDSAPHHEPYNPTYHKDYERYQHSGDYRSYDMTGRDYEDYRRRDYDDYMREDYARRDRHQVEYGKMSDKDIMCWSENLLNSDGTKGEHFKKEQAEHIAKQVGVDVHKFGGIDVFAMTMNMMYADYCSVAKKFNVDRPEYYAELAKAFLDDKDFHGKGEEKLWLYYKCIAEQEE